MLFTMYKYYSYYSGDDGNNNINDGGSDNDNKIEILFYPISCFLYY